MRVDKQKTPVSQEKQHSFIMCISSALIGIVAEHTEFTEHFWASVTLIKEKLLPWIFSGSSSVTSFIFASGLYPVEDRHIEQRD